MDERFQDPNYRGGPSAYRRWHAKVMRRRAALLRARRVSKKTLRDFFFRALDGEFPEDCPEFVAEFFRGAADPMRVAKKWEAEWLREGDTP